MSVKLFVGGLSFSTSSEGLRGAFARFGEVMSAAVMTDRETGRSRGFAFVEMTNPSEADKAIAALNGTELGGRALTINEAKPKTDRPKTGQRFGGGGGGFGGFGGGSSGGGGASSSW